MPRVEISVKTASGQTIVLSQGDRLVKEVTIECNSGRCASRHGQDKPTEVVIVDEKLPEAGEQWLSLILPEGSPQFEAMPKNFCGPQCARDFLVYDYIVPGPHTVPEPTPDANCVTEADGSCVSAEPCMHSPVNQADGAGDPGDETN